MRMDANLTRILKPPVFPSGTNIPMQWTMLADWLPKQFPVDYEEFVRIYGSGLVDGFIVVFTPFSRIEGAQMAYRAGKILDLARRLRDPLYPFPLYPEPSGARVAPHPASGTPPPLHCPRARAETPVSLDSPAGAA